MDAALKQGLHGNDSHYYSFITFPLSARNNLMARNGVGLAGFMTRSGTLDARPRQDVLLKRSGGIIPQDS